MIFVESLVVLVEDVIDVVDLNKKMGFCFVEDEKFRRNFFLLGEVLEWKKLKWFSLFIDEWSGSGSLQVLMFERIVGHVSVRRQVIERW